MKHLVKLFIFGLLFFVGCTSTKTTDTENTSTFSFEFNQTHYIWEGFIFPANKTTGK